MIDRRNIDLLFDLCERHGARRPGDIANFMETHSEWRCRPCMRTKSEIARLDKNGRLLCQIVLHHDHFDEYVPDDLRKSLRSIGFAAESAGRDHLIRFLPELICQDCNTADAAAKRVVGAPNVFSFAPHEIALFIQVTANQSHDIKNEIVVSLYEELRPILRRLSKVVRDTPRRFESTDEWHVLRDPLARVLKQGLEKNQDGTA